MEEGETAFTAASRELGEELEMKAYRAERLFDYASEGSFSDHKVVLVLAGGEPRINDRELESFRWWDGRERLPLYPHDTSIIGRYEAGGRRAWTAPGCLIPNLAINRFTCRLPTSPNCQ